MTLSTENKSIKERDYWLDNVKGILIILVVVAHCIGAIFYNSLVIRQIYYFINLFHMPAFIMISGYFAKRKIDEKDYSGFCVFKENVDYVLTYENNIQAEKAQRDLSICKNEISRLQEENEALEMRLNEAQNKKDNNLYELISDTEKMQRVDKYPYRN